EIQKGRSQKNEGRVWGLHSHQLPGKDRAPREGRPRRPRRAGHGDRIPERVAKNIRQKREQRIAGQSKNPSVGWREQSARDGQKQRRVPHAPPVPRLREDERGESGNEEQPEVLDARGRRSERRRQDEPAGTTRDPPSFARKKRGGDEQGQKGLDVI